MFIQNEFCDGGSLQTLIEAHRAEARHFTEAELRRLLRQVAAGLQYVHGRQLAHLDVKPGNILLCHAEHQLQAGDQEAGDSRELRATYKLADFGHVVPLYGEDVEPEEGDCRYMAPELLALVIDRAKLTSADIFSLGLTVFEAASLRVLPRNSLDSAEYACLKGGLLPRLPHYSAHLNSLLASMVRPEAEQRPSAADILGSLATSEAAEAEDTRRWRLYRELEQTREKLSVLENKLNIHSSSGGGRC